MRHPSIRRDALGFTLIEILVVVFIIATMSGVMVVQLTRDDTDKLHDEGDRLAAVLQAAQDEAVLQSNVFVFEAREKKYRFLRIEKDKFVPLTDGPLASYALPNGVTVGLAADGLDAKPGTRQTLVIDPSGAMQPFEITLRLREARWSVTGSGDGITSGEGGNAQKR
jgi:general secretion pathway protein H